MVRQSDDPAASTGGRSRRDWSIFIPPVLLGILVVSVFLPMLGFEFINYDVGEQVIDNPHIRALTVENLWHIFSSRCITSYYPVRTLTFAIDYQVWGLDPFGFKLTNGLIHLANVGLLFWFTLRLLDRDTTTERSKRADVRRRDIVVAAFAAGVFGVHPLVVEPVCWVPGREELLMTLGLLGCLHLHLTARRQGSREASPRVVWGLHLAAAFCCLLACLSNVVGAVAPLLILAYDVVVERPSSYRKMLLGTLLFWVISSAMIAVKVSGYVAHPGVQEAEMLSHAIAELGYGDTGGPYDPGMFDVERVKLVLGGYWLNLRSLAWPKDLVLAYLPAKPIGFFHPEVVLGGISTVLTCVVLWTVRRRKRALFGFLWFLIALGPVAQIVPHHVIRADRHLYLPLAGLVIGLAIAACPIGDLTRRRTTRILATLVPAFLVLLLAGLAVRQVRVWQDDRSLWTHAVQAVPESPIAHRALADALVKEKKFAQAIAHYDAALKLDGFDAGTASHFARLLATCDDRNRRDYASAIRLAEWANRLTKGRDRSVGRILAIVYNNAAEPYCEQGDWQRAARRYGQAIAADPTYADPILNLALLLSASEDHGLWDLEKAARLAHQAASLDEQLDVNKLMAVAAIYSEAGLAERVIDTITRAIRLADSQGDIDLASQLRGRLRRYREEIQN